MDLLRLFLWHVVKFSFMQLALLCMLNFQNNSRITYSTQLPIRWIKMEEDFVFVDSNSCSMNELPIPFSKMVVNHIVFSINSADFGVIKLIRNQRECGVREVLNGVLFLC